MFQLETHRISTGYQHPIKKSKCKTGGRKIEKNIERPCHTL
jgi:hypothetical protein